MKKLLALSLLLLLVAFGVVTTASASSCSLPIHVALTCPTSVAAGAGFSVSAYVCNESGSKVYLNRGMVGLIGNAAGTLGDAGIYGPFNRNLSWSVPAYGCITRSIIVLNPVPAALGGKIAAVMFSLFNAKGCVIESDGCLVEITP